MSSNSSNKRSLPLGLHFNNGVSQQKNKVEIEEGHSIDQENHESSKYSIALEENTVIFPT